MGQMDDWQSQDARIETYLKGVDVAALRKLILEAFCGSPLMKGLKRCGFCLRFHAKRSFAGICWIHSDANCCRRVSPRCSVSRTKSRSEAGARIWMSGMWRMMSIASSVGLLNGTLRR